jgi:hypothetical protein
MKRPEGLDVRIQHPDELYDDVRDRWLEWKQCKQSMYGDGVAAGLELAMRIIESHTWPYWKETK